MADTCKIREHTSHGNILSWAGKRDNAWVQCRLDRSFGNDEWFHLFPRSKTEYIDMRSSDHRPIRLNFALEVEEKHKGHFFFDKRMMGRRGVDEAIARSWNPGSKGNIAVEFYRDLFMSSNPMDMEPLFVGFPVKELCDCLRRIQRRTSVCRIVWRLRSAIVDRLTRNPGGR
ncbi:hypothetical protein F2Q70_00040825 [Brassica cretica]|uniref:Endonuclease/exonuclease/phosphatase domain-containing protein n=1 Tax=Brassica cretica TaxID=69181 RepID=A0A8S9K2U0_BRACR|nr:hypothetical protein F2Q70_00040825 [Brassica cretica]